jgi:sugar phosphate permease
MALTTPLTGGSDDGAKYAHWQRMVFFITFVNYAMSHFSRKCYTNVKVDLVRSGVDKTILSQMDTAFMLTYALGSFISGRLGDMFPQNVVIGVGLMGSTLCLGMIQVFEASGVVNSNHSMGFFLFVMAQFVHGFFQSTGGPVNTSVMGAWWPKKGRGLVFGLWTCHQYIGDIMAALATAFIINHGWPWQWALLIPGLTNGVWGVVNLFFLPNRPSEVGCESEDDKRAAASLLASGGSASKQETITFMQALMIPNVLGYAIAFGFFKFVNYAMFFWLPFFLSLHFDPQKANVISSLYSFGMMPGGVIVGYVSDLFDGRRACVIAVFMSLLAPLLWVFAMFSDTMPPVLLLVLLGLMGILVGGPNNIITSAVAADLADHPSIGGNTRVLGTVTGIINGSGSITAAFGLMLIGTRAARVLCTPCLPARLLATWQGTSSERQTCTFARPGRLSYARKGPREHRRAHARALPACTRRTGPLQEMGGWTAVWYFLIACVVVGTALMGPKIYKEITAHESTNAPAAPAASSSSYKGVSTSA